MVWQALRHIGRVQLGEAEGRFAQLAVLLLGMREPLHQAVLVDELDASTAFAGVEELFCLGCLPSTYSAELNLIAAILAGVGVISGIVHDIGFFVRGGHNEMCWGSKMLQSAKAICSRHTSHQVGAQVEAVHEVRDSIWAEAVASQRPVLSVEALMRRCDSEDLRQDCGVVSRLPSGAAHREL